MRFSGWLYDLAFAPIEALGLRRARRGLMEGLSGRVLEVGVGTGLNARAAGERGTGSGAICIDRNLGLLRRARTSGAGGELVCADAEALPFRDGEFHAALETLVFCSVARPERVLAEVRRVVRRGGEVRMLDHVRAPGRLLGTFQDALAPAWLAFTGDCRLNRDLSGTLRQSGLEPISWVRRLRGMVQVVVAHV